MYFNPTQNIRRSKDHNVAKYIHEDGSETVIKNSSGCSGDSRDKYSVFLSCSKGCLGKCKYCMLNIKKITYKKLNTVDVISNCINALIDFTILYNPSLKSKPLKIAWMGMGDVSFNPAKVRTATPVIAEWATDPVNGVAECIDRIDMSTSLPTLAGVPGILETLDFIQNNTNEIKFRDPRIKAKLFLSITSAVPKTRKFLYGIQTPIPQMCRIISQNTEPEQVIIHHILLDGINDSDKEVNEFLELLETTFPKRELRILRYNSSPEDPFKESKRFDEIVDRFKKEWHKVKIQDSPGEEIMASCGQFL